MPIYLRWCLGIAIVLVLGVAWMMTELKDRTDVIPPGDDEGLVDDRIEEKNPKFDPELVDRRPHQGWLVNQSAAVIRLDLPQWSQTPEMQVLHPSYQAAMKGAAENRAAFLPSVNLIDGIARQFDEGLYAALDLAWFQGHMDQIESHARLIERLLAKANPSGEAAAYLAAGLTIGGNPSTAGDPAARAKWIADFEANLLVARPLGFYSASDELKNCWRLMKFFQEPMREDSKAAQEMVSILAADAALQADYEKHARFFARLTNPLARFTFTDLIGLDASSEAALAGRRQSIGVRMSSVSLFPHSTSRENELFAKLFPEGLPAEANLMKELVAAIRSGKIDLTPKPNSGWYDHQVYALETLLLPNKGEETQKLLLTREYKKRMLAAFQALITRRRELHMRAFGPSVKSPQPLTPRPENITPRLRVEPCPTFYVRTARSYAFLENFLTAALGEATLKSLHALTADGRRPTDLATELATQRDLFYGLYLISCDDIGLTPKLTDGEVTKRDECYSRAEAWLAKIADEPDLAADTRVAVPIYVDPERRTMRLWVTLGVRLAKLKAEYARPPSIKPASGEGAWEEPTPHEVLWRDHLIAVDEFAEVEAPLRAPPTREEFRGICDRQGTKEEILGALRVGNW